MATKFIDWSIKDFHIDLLALEVGWIELEDKVILVIFEG